MAEYYDLGYQQGMLRAVEICKSVRHRVAETEDQAIGALECALAIMDVMNAREAALRREPKEG